MSRLTILIAALVVAPIASFAQPAAESSAPSGPESALDTFENETREERLERLFGALANSEGDAGSRIADEISKLWAQSGSDSMDLLLTRARKATDDEKFNRARAHLAALTRLAPEFAEGWNASATLYFIEEEYWLAVEHIQKALAIEPRHFGALSGLALILEHVEQKEAALEAWREVVRLFPGMERAQAALDRLAKEVDGKEI